jgi:hypothetical protein
MVNSAETGLFAIAAAMSGFVRRLRSYFATIEDYVEGRGANARAVKRCATSPATA